MPCMRSRRCLMQNDFEAKQIENAKALLETELQVAQHLHQIQKEKHEEQQKKPSFFSRIQSFFSKLF